VVPLEKVQSFSGAGTIERGGDLRVRPMGILPPLEVHGHDCLRAERQRELGTFRGRGDIVFTPSS
jgi:hypothetical protein